MNCQMIEFEYNKMYEVFNNGNSNYIFGCGWMGQNFEKVAKQLGIQIDGFVVSEKGKNCSDNVPLFSISELSKKQGDKNIFVALRDQDQDLNKELRKICKEVYPITYPQDITVIAAQYYINYFRAKGINLEESCIEMKGLRFINPFMQPYDYLLSWVYEAGDLLLPELFGNYDRVDEGPYENGEVSLQKGDVVFDCGANIGLFSTIATQKGCKVYAFEPMPDAINYLRQLQIALDNNFQICEYALSDSVGEAKFHVQNFDLIGASLLENNNSIDQDYIVKVTTIDEFVKQNNIEKVSFIKADIEGSERDMLLGAKNTIKRFSPKLSICTYHLEDDKQVIESCIKAMNPNYIIEHKWKKLFAYVPENCR